MSNLLSFFTALVICVLCEVKPVCGMNPEKEEWDLQPLGRFVLPLGQVTKCVENSTPVPNALAATLNRDSDGHITGVAQSVVVKSSDPINPNKYLCRVSGGELLFVIDGRVHEDLKDGCYHNGGVLYKNCPYKDLSKTEIEKIPTQQYDITLVISHEGGCQTFVAKNETPLDAGGLYLISTTNPKNKIVLDYDWTSVKAITGVDKFQDALETYLGLKPGNTRAQFSSMYANGYSPQGISSAIAHIDTKPGIYRLSYEANSDVLELDDGRGGVWTAPVSEPGKTTSFANGLSVVMGSSFDSATRIWPIGLQVME